jgi:hypothetical protein
MLDIKEIAKLRDNWQLDEAYDATVEALKSITDDNAAKCYQSVLGWILHDQVRVELENFNTEKNTIPRGLNGDQVNAYYAARCLDCNITLDRITNEYRSLSLIPKPSMVHTGMLRVLIGSSRYWRGFMSFVRWWDVDNFSSFDRTIYYPDDGGKPRLSLQTSTFRCIGYLIENRQVKHNDMLWVLEKIKKAVDDQPQNPWLNHNYWSLVLATTKYRQKRKVRGEK